MSEERVRLKPKRKGNPAFRKGHAMNPAGRPVGAVNKTTRLLKHAIITAAERVGEDGKGKEGLIGYLTRLAKGEAKAFAMLLGKVLPMQITGADDKPLIPEATEAMSIKELTGIYMEHLAKMRGEGGTAGLSATKH